MYGPVHARMAEAESDLHSAPFFARAGGQCFAGRVWKFQACSLNFMSVLGAKRTIWCVKKAKNICFEDLFRNKRFFIGLQACLASIL